MYRILCYKSSNKLFGLETKHVKEIYRNPEVTKIPLSNEIIAGVMNLRGQVVTVLDFDKISGSESNSKKKHCIILKNEYLQGDRIALWVDSAEDVIEVEESVCEKPNHNLTAGSLNCIVLIVKLANESLMMLDVEKIIELVGGNHV